jgi:tight adherence protein B
VFLGAGAALLGVGFVGAGLLGAAVVADDTSTPSVTDVHVRAGAADGLLTLSGAAAGKSVDPGSLRVTLGSGPAATPAVAPIARERRSALIVIDSSGSMAGSGLAAAKSAAGTFLDQVPPDVLVGVAGFADRPRLLVAPTLDRSSVRSALGRLRARGSTALYDALGLAVRRLGTEGSRTIVLLSDGADTISRTSLGRAEAQVRSSGVRLAVVGFHTDGTQNRVLAGIARAGHGAVTEALDPDSLQRAFGSAAQEIATQVRFAVPVPKDLHGTQTMTVQGTVQGEPFTVTTSVDLPGVRAGARGALNLPTFVAPRTASPMLWIAAGAVFVGLLALVLAAAAPQLVPVARRRVRELDHYLGSTHRPSADREASPFGGLAAGLTRAADAYLNGRASTSRTALLLERADLPLKLNEWIVLRVLAVPVSAVVFWTLFGESGARLILTLVATVLVGGALPALVLRYLAKRRARQFELQLPDVLTLIASSLSTGFSLAQAIDGITRDASEPAAKEFSRTLAETRIGVDLEDALDRTAERMGSENLAWATMAVRIQRRVGGNLAEVMRTTARTLRDRETLRRQIRALSAEGRLSAYILVALPVLMAAYMYVVRRDYIAQLWQRSLGIAMLSIAGVLLVVGTFWMRRLVNVRV